MSEETIADVQAETAQLLEQIRTDVAPAPAQPEQPKIERFKNGEAVDPLIRLEEKLDMPRAEVDLEYFEANRADIRKLIALRAERAQQQAAAEQFERDKQAVKDHHKREADRRAEERAAIDAQEKAHQDAIDQRWRTPNKLR